MEEGERDIKEEGAGMSGGENIKKETKHESECCTLVMVKPSLHTYPHILEISVDPPALHPKRMPRCSYSKSPEASSLRLAWAVGGHYG